MSVNKKLVKIQKGLRAPKSNFNEFGNFHYRSLEDIVEAAKPLMAEQGAILLLSDEVVLIGDRYYIKSTATLVDSETGDSVSASGLAREAEKKTKMDDAQVTGAASSYARKYALCGLFAIDGQDDADAQGPHEEPVNNQRSGSKNGAKNETKNGAKNGTKNGEKSEAKNEAKNDKSGDGNEIKVILGRRDNFIRNGPLGFRTAQFEDKKIGWVVTVNPDLTEKLANLKAGIAQKLIGDYLPEEEKASFPDDVKKDRVFMAVEIEG